MDIRQSSAWQSFMKLSGWQVEKFSGGVAYIRQFGPFGSFIKIQRPVQNPNEKFIQKTASEYHAWKIILEPTSTSISRIWQKTNPYLASKTIQIQLRKWDKKNLTKKTRYEINKVAACDVSIHISDRVEEFIKLWRRTKKFSFGQEAQITSLYNNFAARDRFVVLATDNGQINAGCLILIFDKVAYYMYAATNKKGRKTSAQYLAVIGAIEESKKRRAKIFDFEGIYDSRYHRQTKSWKGFTHFKKSFGGIEVEFPLTVSRKFFWGF